MKHSGFAAITYSPDDDDETGKGWYAETVNCDGSSCDESPLFATRKEALAWAKEHGATRILKCSD